MLQKLIALALVLVVPAAAAQESESNDRLTLVLGPYVYHYSYDPAHNDYPALTGLEWGPRGSWLDYGVVYFRNSFSQPSVYAYAGKRWFARDDDQGPFLNITAGPLYGYRGQYEDKVPFNNNGLAWAIIPGIGYQYHDFNAQFVLLGSAALLFTFGYDFSK